jgi:hypothetical protein
MMRKVEMIKFETQNDVIDYVCKGLPPRKADYERLKTTIRGTKVDEKIHINPTVKESVDINTFTKVLDHVYENNVRIRDIFITVGGIVVTSCIIKLIIELCKKMINR